MRMNLLKVVKFTRQLEGLGGDVDIRVTRLSSIDGIRMDGPVYRSLLRAAAARGKLRDPAPVMLGLQGGDSRNGLPANAHLQRGAAALAAADVASAGYNARLVVPRQRRLPPMAVDLTTDEGDEPPPRARQAGGQAGAGAAATRGTKRKDPVKEALWATAREQLELLTRTEGTNNFAWHRNRATKTRSGWTFAFTAVGEGAPGPKNIAIPDSVVGGLSAGGGEGEQEGKKKRR
jgi:hypothetical protein